MTMRDLDYKKQAGSFKLELLMDELVEALAPAGIVPYVQGSPDGSEVKISLPEGVDTRLIDLIVEGHDASKPSQGESLQAQKQTSEAALAVLDIEGMKADISGAKDLSEIQATVLKLIEAVEHVLIATGRQ